MSNHAYEKITARIVFLLEQGTVPWQPTWNTTRQMPRNIVSGKQYRGINVFLLLAHRYESPVWLTFRQAEKLKARVKKGERGCPVIFWKRLSVADSESEEKRIIPLLRFYHVFNLAQCEGIEGGESPINGPQSKPEEIVAAMQKRPHIKSGFERPFYSPREDVVGMPKPEGFKRNEDYFATLFHELVHSTGHETRLNRPAICERTDFGSDPYGKEELTAEMGATFLCSQAGIVERTIENSSSYIQSWLTRLRGDVTLVVQAAAQAQKAADFILGRTYEESEAADATH